MHQIAEITEDCRKADSCIFGNFAGDKSVSYGSKDPAQAVPGNHVIRATLQPASTSIAFLFRNHTLWDLNHHTSNSLESQQPMDMKHCPSSAGICHRRFCRFFFRSDRCPNPGLFGNSGQDESARPRQRGGARSRRTVYPIRRAARIWSPAHLAIRPSQYARRVPRLRATA